MPRARHGRPAGPAISARVTAGRCARGCSGRRAAAWATGNQELALPESATGLAIMRACVDDVTLSSSPGRATVVSLQSG